MGGLNAPENNKPIYKPEKNVLNQPRSISVEEMDILKILIKNNICIIKDNLSTGTGFFCRIKCGDKWSSIRTLITCNHVFGENVDIKNKTIEFSINKNNFRILIDESRKIYTSKKYDITIIEITKEDGIDIDSFFDIDNDILSDNLIDIYKDKEVYLLHCPKGESMSYSQGKIIGINVNNYNFEHSCDSDFGSSGGPIIDNRKYKVIGFHIGAAVRGKNCNYGTFLNAAIKEFLGRQKEEHNNNEINNKKRLKNENNINFNDEITIKYRIKNNENKVKIFDIKFVKNNNKLCKLFINGKEKELCSYLEIKEFNLKKNIFEIKLKGLSNITNMSYMFNGCDSLVSIIDIENIKNNNVIDMSYMFSECKELKYLPDISSLKTHNVINLKNIFYCCKSLTYLPDISKWDTHNVTDMSYMFCNCESLKSLPDVSKFDTQNVTDMSYMFCNCIELRYIPNISNWNTQNVKNMTYMFCNCKLVGFLPDLSKWEMHNTTNINSMFSNCESLKELPDISKWDTSNVIDISYIFYNCKSLKKVPDISKWNSQNINYMNEVFSKCESLLYIPDISNYRK